VSVSISHGNRPQRAVLLLVLLSALLLSGCARYELGLQFQGPHRGTLVQHVRLGEQLAQLSPERAQQWLRSIERRARRLGGRAQRRSQREVRAIVPFASAPELVRQFERFYHPAWGDPDRQAPEAPQLDASIELQQSNLLLLQRNRLQLNLDLRALEMPLREGAADPSARGWDGLTVRLRTPWGANHSAGDGKLAPEREADGTLVWQLQPGQRNAIAATFWLPEPLGIGAVAIALLAAVGFYLKYRYWPGSPAAGASDSRASSGG